MLTLSKEGITGFVNIIINNYPYKLKVEVKGLQERVSCDLLIKLGLEFFMQLQIISCITIYLGL